MTSTDSGQPGRRRPTLAVWKFASCDGCQLSLLNCEDQLSRPSPRRPAK